MNIKTAVITIAVFGVIIVLAAYVIRGEWGIGAEWVLPVLMAAVVPIKEGRKEGRDAR